MIGALNIAILLVAVVLIFLANRWHCSRAQRILEHWAQSNGYEIVSSNHWEIITGQEVYSVTIRTAAGEIRNRASSLRTLDCGYSCKRHERSMGRLACDFQLPALSFRPSRHFR